MKDFAVRTVTAVIGIILLYFIITTGGLVLDLTVLALILVGLTEIRETFKQIDINLNLILLISGAVFTFLSIYFLGNIKFVSYFLMLLVAIDLLFLRNTLLGSSALAFSLFYVILGLSSLSLIRNPIFIGLVFIIAFSTDTFAYLVGVTFGKHKLIPSVSPNKSIEGAIGGIAASVIITTLYLNYFGFSILKYDILLGLFGSIIAQCGDLVASRIKRETGIKDFGSIIPGHGGVLDRFDSVLLVAPVVYILFVILYS